MAFVRTDVSEERVTFIIRADRISELGKTAYVRFEVFTAVTMKNGVFWDVNAVWLL
jgi:hypothetical protein